MGVIGLKPSASIAQPIKTSPEAMMEPNKSTFTSLFPETVSKTLLKYVEGYPWTISYYGQLLNTNNTVERFDPSTPNLNQSYYLVNDMVLQVSSPLSSNYEQTTGVTTITGSGLTPYKITPNVGDVFIANVDSGEDAIFLVTSVTRKTYRKDTIYEIDYSLYSYTSTTPDFVTRLSERVQDSYWFNKDTDYFNRDVLIKPSVKEAIDRLKLFVKESKELYFRKFSIRGNGGILVPGLREKLYDPHMVSFISKTIDNDTLVTNHSKTYSFSDPYIEQPTFLDMFLSRNINLDTVINPRQVFTSVIDLQASNPRLGYITHTGMDAILYPVDPSNSVYGFEPIDAINIYNPVSDTNTNDYNRDISVSSNNNGVFSKPLLHSLFVGGFYIVSENFYLGENTSFIEDILYKFITREGIAREDLAIACEDFRSWSDLHQFYLLPLLWVICNN